MPSAKTIVGRREWISLSDFKLPPLLAKVDTGARSSSLHARNIRRFTRNDGPWVSFQSVGGQECEAPLLFEKKVKSSNGEVSFRYFIELVTQFPNGREFEIIFSLACRQTMRCPALLGRRALRSFLVDSSRSHLLGSFDKG